METLMTLTKEATKEQFENVVTKYKGALQLTATDSLLFSVRATDLGYDFQLDEVVKGVVLGSVEHNVLLHSQVTQAEAIEYGYKVFKQMIKHVSVAKVDIFVWPSGLDESLPLVSER